MRIVHYLNQFFGGIGGENRADAPPTSRHGAVGPGVALQRMLGADATIVGTGIARDVIARIAAFAPDVVVAGPAFDAGRYGLACGRVCHDVIEQLRRPAITGMHRDNAAVALYRRDVVIVSTAATAIGMTDALTA